MDTDGLPLCCETPVGWSMTSVERLWRREGLKVPMKQPKRGRLWLNDGSCIRLRPEYCDHVWSYDFVHHRTDDGKVFRALNILDEYSRECLAIRVERKLNSTDVMDVLTDLLILRGVPAFIRSDNGPEFVAEAVRNWINAVGAKTAYIEPGSPWENGYCESFNARFRDELLNGEIFYTLQEAQIIIEKWRGITTQRDRTVHWATDRQPVTSMKSENSNLRRSKVRDQRSRLCTNIQTGPLNGGRP
jgi:putative transposase